MKLTAILLLLNLFFQHISAQTTEEFLGVLKVDNNTVSYKINYSRSKNGNIIGESVTDVYGPDRTVANITGTFDEKTKTISFKEIKNKSTKSKAKESSFCFIHVTSIKIKTSNDKQVIEGEFKGVFSNGKVCSQGFIYLVSSDVLDKLKGKGVNIDSLKNVEKIENINPSHNLKSNDKIELKWISSNLIIEVWDNYSEDKDLINILFNDRKIADKLEIKNDHHRINQKIEKGKSVIKLIAIDEGTSPMNTVNILLLDGDKPTLLTARLKKGEVVIIQLNKN